MSKKYTRKASSLSSIIDKLANQYAILRLFIHLPRQAASAKPTATAKLRIAGEDDHVVTVVSALDRAGTLPRSLGKSSTERFAMQGGERGAAYRLEGMTGGYGGADGQGVGTAEAGLQISNP